LKISGSLMFTRSLSGPRVAHGLYEVKGRGFATGPPEENSRP